MQLVSSTGLPPEDPGSKGPALSVLPAVSGIILRNGGFSG